MFKMLVEKQAKCVIKRLRINGGREYTSSEFAQFCEEEWIEREVITPYTHKHNGIID